MTRFAVLFDMDGTLVDSEPAHFEAMAEVLRLHGHAVPAALAGMVTGMTGADCHALLGELTGFKPSFEDYVRDKYGFYLAMASGLAMRPGAQSVLDALQDGAIPWAIVSNSDRMLVDANLRAVGLQRPGLVSVSRNDVRDGKPQAEPYLRAAYLLGKAPSDCIVVEDSVPGAIAGLAAGMTVIGWPEPHRNDLVFPAGTVLADPHDLLTTLSDCLDGLRRRIAKETLHVSR